MEHSPQRADVENIVFALATAFHTLPSELYAILFPVELPDKSCENNMNLLFAHFTLDVNVFELFVLLNRVVPIPVQEVPYISELYAIVFPVPLVVIEPVATMVCWFTAKPVTIVVIGHVTAVQLVPLFKLYANTPNEPVVCPPPIHTAPVHRILLQDIPNVAVPPNPFQLMPLVLIAIRFVVPLPPAKKYCPFQLTL